MGARHLDRLELTMYYVYVLQDEADSNAFYIGCTSNLKRRLSEQNAGYNQSTKSTTWHLVYYEAFKSLSLARRREYRLKTNCNAKRQLLSRIL